MSYGIYLYINFNAALMRLSDFRAIWGGQGPGPRALALGPRAWICTGTDQYICRYICTHIYIYIYIYVYILQPG